MQAQSWLSVTALVASIMAIGLGIAALVLALALDDDGPSLGHSAAPLRFAEQRAPADGFGNREATPQFQLPNSEQFGERFREAFPNAEGVFSEGAFLGVNVVAGDDGATIEAVVPGSAADEAGLESGDVITAVDNEPVVDVSTLAAALRSHEPGDEVNLSVRRGDESIEVEVTLGERALRGSLEPRPRTETPTDPTAVS